MTKELLLLLSLALLRPTETLRQHHRREHEALFIWEVCKGSMVKGERGQNHITE